MLTTINYYKIGNRKELNIPNTKKWYTLEMMTRSLYACVEIILHVGVWMRNVSPLGTGKLGSSSVAWFEDAMEPFCRYITGGGVWEFLASPCFQFTLFGSCCWRRDLSGSCCYACLPETTPTNQKYHCVLIRWTLLKKECIVIYDQPLLHILLTTNGLFC